MRLDTKSVAALRLDGKKDLIVFDEAMPGFGHRLRLLSGGREQRTWIAQYKAGGVTRRILLGSYEVLGAEAARAAARKVLARVALGQDPSADKRERRSKDRLSLRAVIDQYLGEKERELRSKTLREVTRYLTGPYFKPLHGMPVDKVSRKDIAARLVAIARDHSNIVASKARDTLSAFYVWCLQSGLCEANPVIGTRKPEGNPARERVLSDQELVAIWSACKDDDYGRIIRLCVLLCSRRAEIGGLAFSELDLEGPQPSWTLPAKRSKNGVKHTLPLMPMALDIIRAVPRLVSRDQLFGARSENGFASWDKGKLTLDARSGVSNWTPRDIRRSAATKMADIGIAPHIIETILNHVGGHKGGVAGIYNKSSYVNEVRRALAIWEDHLRSLVEGGERKVVPMPHAAS
jgi:integrase